MVALHRLLRSRSRAMVALEYIAIGLALLPLTVIAFQLIGRGMMTYAQTKIQTQLTFSNIPDQDLSGGVYGGGSQAPPGGGQQSTAGDGNLIAVPGPGGAIVPDGGQGGLVPLPPIPPASGSDAVPTPGDPGDSLGLPQPIVISLKAIIAAPLTKRFQYPAAEVSHMADIAREISRKPGTQIWCTPSWSAWLQAARKDGFSVTRPILMDWTVSPNIPNPKITMHPGDCTILSSASQAKDFVSPLTLAIGLNDLAHEAVHALGYYNEAKTECYAMQLIPYVASQYGYGKTEGRALTRDFYTQSYPFLMSRFRSSKCHNDGPWDLYPKSDSFPAP